MAPPLQLPSGEIPPSMLNNLPGLEPPPGVKSNFVNPENRGPILIIICTILMSFVLIFYANRIYVKTYIIRRITWDDLTCSIGLVGAILIYSTSVWVASEGLAGKHQWNVTLAELISKDYAIPSFIFVSFVPLTMLFIKLTFFLLYIQIFQPMRWLRISSYVNATALCAFYGACTVAQLIFTIPRSSETWSSHFVGSESAKANILSVPLSAVGLFFDVVILVLPIAGIMRLQLPTRRRIGILLIFLTGLLACICSLLSIYYRVILNRGTDTTWDVFDVELMAAIEMDLGIICSCMPALSKTLRHHLPLLKSFRKSLYSRLRSSHPYESKSNGSNTQSNSSTPFPVVASKSPGTASYAHTGTEYSNEHDSCAQPSYELGQLQSVRTFIGTTQAGAALDDKIHLTHEILQQG